MSKQEMLIRAIYLAVKRINKWLEEHRIRVYASQAAFFIIISAVPMLIFVLSFFGYFMPNGEEMYSYIAEVFPEGLTPYAMRILSEINEKSNIPLLSVSAFTLLWSASSGIRGIGAGIRNVYGGEKDKSYVLFILKSIGITLLYICSVILALIVWVFGDMILKAVPNWRHVGALKVLNSAALFLLLSAVFMLTYRVFGGQRSREIREAPGAFLSAAAWFLFSALFEYYVEHFGRYSYVYGSLASIIVVMLWLYFCMEILLVGAGINILLSRRKRIE
ncbi:MAG: YihY/virulence factor BrkB family protein [Clostridia bacterium]|nr:YihY/virulence factor BrkB family protein [Clostridia bacterium]